MSDKKEDQFEKESPYDVRLETSDHAILNTPPVEEPNISFTLGKENDNEEVLRFTPDKMFLRGKEVECPQDIIDGMRAWLTQWNYIATQPTDENGITIAKDPQEGELVILHDNDHFISRMTVNPWTMKVSDYKYSMKK